MTQTSEHKPAQLTFASLGISEPLCQAVSKLGFETPMPVQEAVIPYLLGDDIDLIALAQTGTGKTAAFGLPLLQKLSERGDAAESGHPVALILSPTRELCVQIANDLAAYADNLPAIRTLSVYGGSSIELQMRDLSRGVHIVVATPGRLMDLMRRKAISFDRIHTVVLDEADEMLNMGFSEAIEEIMAHVPEQRHLLLFSATMPREIANIARRYLHDPKEIVVGNRNMTNENIEHVYYVVSAKHKYIALKRIADFYPNIYGIVFCRTRAETKEVADHLIKDGYNADALHGDLSQAQRDYVMQRFRLGSIGLLVATDVAARGLDVDNLSHVIHYGLPDDTDLYTHRSGRTARAGRKGMSIAICHSRERMRIRQLEDKLRTKFARAFLPDGESVCEKQILGLVDRILAEDPTPTDVPEVVVATARERLGSMDRNELLSRIVSMEFRRLLEYYRVAPVIEEADEKGRLPLEGRMKSERQSEKRGRPSDEGMVRLSINFGKQDRLFPNKLIELINHCCPGSRVNIGKIDLFAHDASFDVDAFEADEVIAQMNRYEVDGRPIHVTYGADKTSRRQAPKPTASRMKAPRGSSDRQQQYKSKKHKSKEKNGERFYDRFRK